MTDFRSVDRRPKVVLGGFGTQVKPSLCALTCTYTEMYSRRMDAVLDAISEPHRRTLLRALAEAPATVNELAELMPIARPGVSRHLRILREAGLVVARQDAQRRIYELRPEPLAELDEWLEPYRALWTQRLDALDTEVNRGKRERKAVDD